MNAWCGLHTSFVGAVGRIPFFFSRHTFPTWGKLQQPLPQDILFCVEDAQIVAAGDDYFVTKVEYLPFQRPLLKIRLPPGIRKKAKLCFETRIYTPHPLPCPKIPLKRLALNIPPLESFVHLRQWRETIHTIALVPNEIKLAWILTAFICTVNPCPMRFWLYAVENNEMYRETNLPEAENF